MFGLSVPASWAAPNTMVPAPPPTRKACSAETTAAAGRLGTAAAAAGVGPPPSLDILEVSTGGDGTVVVAVGSPERREANPYDLVNGRRRFNLACLQGSMHRDALNLADM